MTEDRESTLNVYAETVCKRINSLLSHIGKLLSAEVMVSNTGGLTSCHLWLHGAADPSTVSTSRVDTPENILATLPNHLRAEAEELLPSLIGIRVYNEEELWIIGHSEQKPWTEESAREDANTIIREHLKVSAR